MSPHRIVAAIVLASVLAPAAPALADPAYLPPFLSRTPALGDRWVYAAYDILGNQSGSVTVEVVEAAEDPEGSRYLVEHQLEFLPTTPNAEVQPVLRTEWFHRLDGTIWRGDLWVDGELSVYLPKPLLVIRDLPQSVLERRRFGHIGWPKPVKRRGWVSMGISATFPGSRLLYPVRMRLGDRTHPTLSAEYDGTLGRFRWTDRAGLHRSLVYAVIDGVAYEP